MNLKDDDVVSAVALVVEAGEEPVAELPDAAAPAVPDDGEQPEADASST
jgi:hypothetical protein